ncbi:MAG TPA: hypothetical protein DEP24_14010 [Mycobacterium sp.]|nr:hypothetical protein [Mycobacterium sp.]
MQGELPSAHSPLGASSAKRFLECPASVGLGWGVVDDESDHASLGTAAHSIGEYCLNVGLDAWECIGKTTVGNTPVDKDMADAVQVYLDFVRSNFPNQNQGNTWVERRFHCPSLHELFYGTSDFAHLNERHGVLHIVDYKHGAGIVVEATDNPQLMYYACGMLEDLMIWDHVETVVLWIAQPRGFHFDGPIRRFEISVADLQVWLWDELLPGMDRALASHDTKSGEHCRFCPARFRACPQIKSDLEELEKLMTDMSKRTAPEWTNEELGRFASLFDIAKVANKAHDSVIFERLQAGQVVQGKKLAAARTNREWKPEVEDEAKKVFGDRAYTDPELKSPAEIEKLAKGKDFTARWAFKPEGKLTVVSTTDARPAISKDTKSMFEKATKQRKGAK